MSLHHSSTSLILFSPLFLTFSFFLDLNFLGSAIEAVNEFWSHVQLTGFAVHWEVLGRRELPIQVTALNAHPAWCASLCPSRWIQPFPSTSLSLSRHLRPPLPPVSRQPLPLMHLPHSVGFTLSKDSQAGFLQLLSNPHFFVSFPPQPVACLGR